MPSGGDQAGGLLRLDQGIQDTIDANDEPFSLALVLCIVLPAKKTRTR